MINSLYLIAFEATLFIKPPPLAGVMMIQKQLSPPALPPAAHQQPPITQNQLTEIWQAIKELQSQQQALQAAIHQLKQVPNQSD